VPQVANVLHHTGLHPKYLEMELTESMVMHNVETAVATLGALKSLGVSLSVDDFGTGYSSLAALRDLPIDKLKIDRSFMREIAEGRARNAHALVGAIVALARHLGLRVVAEGVETPAQAQFLKRSKCHEVQGFLYGAPVEASAHAVVLRARGADKRKRVNGRKAPQSSSAGAGVPKR
jgi:EAL domain-containing protein (putative c-di-GMP-specific phosphodiesterase class I)